jgi:hypothetical protein
MWVAVIVGYIVKVPPGWSTLSYGLVNLPMYSMEIKHMLTNKLDIISSVEDLGPVEIELIFFTIFSLAGLFGVSGVDNSLKNDLEINFIPECIKWSHIIVMIFVILYVIFILENI